MRFGELNRLSNSNDRNLQSAQSSIASSRRSSVSSFSSEPGGIFPSRWSPDPSTNMGLFDPQCCDVIFARDENWISLFFTGIDTSLPLSQLPSPSLPPLSHSHSPAIRPSPVCPSWPPWPPENISWKRKMHTPNEMTSELDFYLNNLKDTLRWSEFHHLHHNRRFAAGRESKTSVRSVCTISNLYQSPFL